MTVQSEAKDLEPETSERHRLMQAWSALQMPVIATVAGLFVTSVLLLSIDVNPLDVYTALLRGALGSLFGISSTLRWATPLVLAGLAVSIGFKAGLFNAAPHPTRKVSASRLTGDSAP